MSIKDVYDQSGISVEVSIYVFGGSGGGWVDLFGCLVTCLAITKNEKLGSQLTFIRNQLFHAVDGLQVCSLAQLCVCFQLDAYVSEFVHVADFVSKSM